MSPASWRIASTISVLGRSSRLMDPAGTWATGGVGAALVLYAAWGLSRASVGVPAGYERWLGPLVGMLTGLMAAATGVFAVPAVPYLVALLVLGAQMIVRYALQ